MKKYSADYFDKKFKVLFNKLLAKEGFLNTIKKIRAELEIPEGGFDNEPSLAYFLINKMSNDEWQFLAFSAFIQKYEQKNKIAVTEENSEKVIKAFLKEANSKKDGGGIFQALFKLGNHIENHNELFTSTLLKRFTKNKFLSKLSPRVFDLLNTFWGYDLLDEQIIVHLVEKYLFLGDYGVNQYIKNKVACSSCKYIGIVHFSPNRHDMQGDKDGAISENYIFNEAAVRRLSSHFNSVFLIIKPYAVKEQVLQYIEDNWENLKEHVIEKNTFYKQLGVNPSKIKESHIEQNQLVYELYKASKKELLKMYKGERSFTGTGIYKETIIAAILEEQYDIHMGTDAIKKAATRFSKSTKLKKEPKDIEDI